MVKIGADLSGFSKGMKDVQSSMTGISKETSKTMKGAEKSTKGASTAIVGSLKGIGTALVGAFAVSELTQFGVSAIEAGANAITYTPPSNGELFRRKMETYREQEESKYKKHKK